MAALSATPDCCWNASAPPSDFQRLSGISECEVLVVGAGIVGLSAALSLYQAGKSRLVLVAREVCRQVTGRSTTEVTTPHGLFSRYLLGPRCQEPAWRCAAADREGVAQIRQWVTNLGIDCASH